MSDVDLARAWFAEDLRVTCGLTSPSLVSALGRVPRDRFLGPGPWLIRGEYDAAGPPRPTESADPRLVHHNVSVAIDPARNLYNGQPGLVARWLDSLDIPAGGHVVHIGCGTGYFTAVVAQMVGPEGRVTAVDVDAGLAARARGNLSSWPQVDVRHGDGIAELPAGADVVLVHAGATHVLDPWLDAIRDGGRLLVPIAFTFPGMPGGVAKGTVVTIRREGDCYPARAAGMVMIYALVGGRDEAMNQQLATAFGRSVMPAITHLRRDRHEPSAACWLHGETTCLAADREISRRP